MKRESWFAIVLTLALLCAGVGWLAWRAPQMADPGPTLAEEAVARAEPPRLASPPSFYERRPPAGALERIAERALFTPDPEGMRRAIEIYEPPEPLRRLDAQMPPDIEPDPALIASEPQAPPPQTAPERAPPQLAVGQAMFRSAPPPGYALKGVFTSEAGGAAIIQLPNGALARMKVGDTLLGGWRILAISTNSIDLARGSAVATLRLPGG